MKVPDVPYRALTHRRQVLALYKNALRNIYSVYLGQGFDGRSLLRIEAVLLRQRFDENRNCSENEAKELLIKGQQELKDNECACPLTFAASYGGLLHNRAVQICDSVLDFWHPLEKAQYPEYFARREQRKEEFIKMWCQHHSTNDH